MRSSVSLTAGVCLLAMSIAAAPAAQGPPAPQGAGGAAAAGRQAGPAGAQGRGRQQGPATFPAQQRQLPPADVIARGRGLYDVNCRLCHGADLRGGDMGGVNLLRSALVFNDQNGELIKPVVQNGRSNPGMPAMPPFAQLTDADIQALAGFLHSVQATMRGQGNPPASEKPVELNIVVGDPKAGQAYFQAKCSSCHSATGDLRGLASRIPEPMQLQTAWVAGGAGGGRGGFGRGGGEVKPPTPTTVTVTLASGQTFQGTLIRYDDFVVSMRLADGIERSFRRNGDVPKVEIKEPKAPHIKLLPTYTDKDIHDVTAYLVTLK
ncbi:MAG: c-type cytochrome [Acidobacteria bacterium]|nr:c-type cytochrome [Acidobacteriota bacterium]